MADFPVTCTVEAGFSFTRWQCYSYSSTEGKCRDLARAQGSYLHEALFDFICSFILSSLYRI